MLFKYDKHIKFYNVKEKKLFLKMINEFKYVNVIMILFLKYEQVYV